ncbi:MAG TPA: hypothetical protein PKJ41_16940 [Bryobacteraceae bacterium]|nr:hypothetical protein [Bryobacteraceae bacterium]HPT26511.1 hypothetical protein [Bryobacteraceae bacterium]
MNRRAFLSSSAALPAAVSASIVPNGTGGTVGGEETAQPTPSGTPPGRADRNGRQAAEALARSRRVMKAWLDMADPVTGLLPRTVENRAWVIRDSAADLYPFLVLLSRFVEPELHETVMRYILRQEMLLTQRVDRLSDDVLPGGKGWVRTELSLDEVIFGSSEYAKDGLVPITELLGATPWYRRLVGISADIVRHAPYKTRHGRIPARSGEVNGNVLQSFSRLCWRTGDPALEQQLLSVADLYFLEVLPATGYLPPDFWSFEKGAPEGQNFTLSDHGNEIALGLSEAYVYFTHKRPEKARQYKEPFMKMIDRMLETGRNQDGVWFSKVDLATGKPSDTRVVHCWGYPYNAVYTAWLATGETRYKAAVEKAIDGVIRESKYLFDETGSGRKWGSNAYSDSLESAIVFLNRLPNPVFEDAIDAAFRKFFDRQRPDGIIEGWYGDGNFVRTSLMYTFLKTQGTFASPWPQDLVLGAVPDGGGILIRLSSGRSWRGRLCFDTPRHREFWNMPVNYTRLNEYPEWFTVEQDRTYDVTFGHDQSRRAAGSDLVQGIPLAVDPGQPVELRVTGPLPYPAAK